MWTTFNEWQWDLNWANPDVLVEFADIICSWPTSASRCCGWTRSRSSGSGWAPPARTSPRCTRSPRCCARSPGSPRPALAFKAEAIVGPRDLVQYLGQGRHAGRVSDLAYHNSLMVQVWSMLATGDTVLARHALAALPTDADHRHLDHLRPLPRRHRLGDRRPGRRRGRAQRATTTGGSWPTGTPATSPAPGRDGLVFQHNPATGDKRISGTAAVPGRPRRRDDGDAGAGLARLFLAHAVVAGWGGVPVVWSGDELGQPNDPDWAAEPGHEDDNRWAHRPRLDWDARRARATTCAPCPGRVFAGLAHLARVRAGLPQLHASASSRVLHDTDAGVLAIVRRHPSGPMVGPLQRDRARPARSPSTGCARRPRAPYDALGGYAVTAGADGLVWLPAYAAWWVVDGPTDRTGDASVTRATVAPHPTGRGSRAVWSPRLPSIR